MLTASLQSTWAGNNSGGSGVDSNTSPSNSNINILAQQQQQRSQNHSRQKGAARFGIPVPTGDLSASQGPINVAANGGLNGGKSLFSTQAAASSSPSNYALAPNGTTNYSELPNLKANRLNSGGIGNGQSSPRSNANNNNKEVSGSSGNKKYRAGSSSSRQQQQQQQQSMQGQSQQAQIIQQQQQQQQLLQAQASAQGNIQALASGSRASRRHKYASGPSSDMLAPTYSYGTNSAGNAGPGPGGGASQTANDLLGPGAYSHGSNNYGQTLLHAHGSNASNIKSLPDMGQILPQISTSSSSSSNNSGNNGGIVGGANVNGNASKRTSASAMFLASSTATGAVNFTVKEVSANISNNFTGSEEHFSAAVTSTKGLKPGNPNWTNQDNYFVIENFDPNRDVRLYCVLDGHGEHGHHVSRRCRELFPQIIKSCNMDINHAFYLMQGDLNSSEIDVKCSGATCVLATLINGKLSVYNCGDSRAVLGRRNPNGSITAHALTNDHKPDKPEERKRILNCGGHLGCRQVLVNQPGRGPVSMPVGPCRVWYQHRGETLGLAMSRSLGDAIVHKCGVSAEPEVLEHQVDEMDEFIIIATDGVWDVVDNAHAAQMVQNIISKAGDCQC